MLPLDTGDSMMIHLRMSGRVLIDPVDRRRGRDTPTSCCISPGPVRREELRFVDPRTFGEVVVFDPANAAVEMPELARLGVDPIADGLDRAAARATLLAAEAAADEGAAARPAA